MLYLGIFVFFWLLQIIIILLLRFLFELAFTKILPESGDKIFQARHKSYPRSFLSVVPFLYIEKKKKKLTTPRRPNHPQSQRFIIDRKNRSVNFFSFFCTVWRSTHSSRRCADGNFRRLKVEIISTAVGVIESRENIYRNARPVSTMCNVRAPAYNMWSVPLHSPPSHLPVDAEHPRTGRRTEILIRWRREERQSIETTRR